MEEEAEWSDMRERDAEGGSSWDMIGRAPCTGIAREEVNVFGSLFGKSVGRASESHEAPSGGVRGDLSLREGVVREWGSMYLIVGKQDEGALIRSVAWMCGSGH